MMDRVVTPARVLIVDSDTTFRRATAKILADQGYDNREASTGQEALDRLDSGVEIGAVLCDIQMPAESGFDVLTHIAANFPDVAVPDLVVHPTTSDLVIATHGRGIWIIDDISPWR